MGILDELRKEAESEAARKVREAENRERALLEARRRLEPSMQAIYKYFSELKQHLELLNKEVLASYEIKGAGLVQGMKQGNYGLSTGRPDRIDNLTFRCACVGRKLLQVNQRDAASVAAYREYLKQHRLQAKERDAGGGSAVFLVQPVVHVSVMFTADVEKAAIELRIRNLVALGVARHTLTTEQASEKLLDELAKALLRKDNEFDEMVGCSLTSTGKIRLRKSIQAVARQRQIEEERALKEAAREQSLTKRFGRTLLGRKGA